MQLCTLVFLTRVIALIVTCPEESINTSQLDIHNHNMYGISMMMKLKAL